MISALYEYTNVTENKEVLRKKEYDWEYGKLKLKKSMIKKGFALFIFQT